MAMIRELLDDGDATRVPIRLCLDVGHMGVPAPRRRIATRTRGRARSAAPRRSSSSSNRTRTATTTGRSPERTTPRVASTAERVIEALGEGGVEESALVLEVIPPFEQDDDAVLDDLAGRSTTGAMRSRVAGSLAGS